MNSAIKFVVVLVFGFILLTGANSALFASEREAKIKLSTAIGYIKYKMPYIDLRTREEITGYLSNGYSQTYKKTLWKTNTYALLLVGDDDYSDLDITVTDSYGKVQSVDTSSSANGIVFIEPEQIASPSEEFTITIKLDSTKDYGSYYGLGILYMPE